MARGPIIRGHHAAFLSIEPPSIHTLAAPISVKYRCVRDLECLHLMWSARGPGVTESYLPAVASGKCRRVQESCHRGFAHGTKHTAIARFVDTGTGLPQPQRELSRNSFQ